MSTGTPIEIVKTIAALALALIIGFAGSAEVIRWVLKWGFKKKSRMVVQLEGLEARIADLHKETASLREEKKLSGRRLAEETAKYPQAAIARAEKELRNRNDTSAIYHLEEWFKLNAPSICAIALRLARYHIAQALPDPGDHLRRADQMLRLARGATPGDQEAREIFSEFSQVNAALQEQTIQPGGEVIAWNAAKGKGPNVRGERLRPPPHQPWSRYTQTPPETGYTNRTPQPGLLRPLAGR